MKRSGNVLAEHDAVLVTVARAAADAQRERARSGRFEEAATIGRGHGRKFCF